jgi:integrase
MPRATNRLSALAVTRAKKPGMYADGGGLYLQVTSAGARSWIFRYARNGRSREMGLGALSKVPLATARLKAEEAREDLGRGQDPIQARQARKAEEAAEAARQVTFEDAADSYINSHRAGWRNAKHGDQWKNTLRTYAYPAIGSVPVRDIETGMVLKVLEPIWTIKTETANRVRGRIEAVLDWARARGHRQGENPARWRGHLDDLLPRPGKVRRVQHHPALPYSEIGAFMAELRKQEGVAALALEFLILTASRTGEAIGARWSEIDLQQRLWTIPAERIKAGREHRVPLSSPTIIVLREVAKLRRTDGYVFPGDKQGKHLSNGALLMLLERMNRGDLTVHGFRSTFRDWAAEQTNFPREVAEMALAHVVEDKTEAAYRRGDLFVKRQKLMDTWAAYCATKQRGRLVNIADARKRKGAAR